MGDQTLCSAFSAGGKYFVTGGTDHILRVYVCIPGPPVLQAELDGHKVVMCVMACNGVVNLQYVQLWSVF